MRDMKKEFKNPDTMLIKDINDIRKFLEKNEDRAFTIYRTEKGYAIMTYSGNLTDCKRDIPVTTLARYQTKPFRVICTAEGERAILDAGISLDSDDDLKLAYCENGMLIIEKIKRLETIAYVDFRTTENIDAKASYPLDKLKDIKWGRFVKHLKELENK